MDKRKENRFVEGYLYGHGDGSAEPFGKACWFDLVSDDGGVWKDNIRRNYRFYDRLIDEYRKKVETINVLEAGADAVKKTITFRVGEILLYIPRSIKLVFFR